MLGCAIDYGSHGGYAAKVTLQLSIEDPDANSSWSTIAHTENSTDNPYVVVLRDGDLPPALPGFQNQAIYLFELDATFAAHD